MSNVPQQFDSPRHVDVLEYGREREGVGGLLGRTFASKRFAVAFAVLLVAAAGLNLTVNALKLNFRKLPVPLRISFEQALPGDKPLGGQWVQIARTLVLDEDVEHSLGTKTWLFCGYVNVKEPDRQKALQAKIGGMTVREQEDELADLRKREQPAVGVGLTYYTGQVDTVAHIPERCYLGGGFEEASSRRHAFAISDPRTHQKRAISARLLTFKSPGSRVRRVAYFFRVNGQYEDDPTVVRAVLADLRQRRAYYAKIELSFDAVTEAEQRDEKAATSAMEEFLNSALPELERAWPELDKQ